MFLYFLEKKLDVISQKQPFELGAKLCTPKWDKESDFSTSEIDLISNILLATFYPQQNVSRL